MTKQITRTERAPQDDDLRRARLRVSRSRRGQRNDLHRSLRPPPARRPNRAGAADRHSTDAHPEAAKILADALSWFAGERDQAAPRSTHHVGRPLVRRGSLLHGPRTECDRRCVHGGIK